MRVLLLLLPLLAATFHATSPAQAATVAVETTTCDDDSCRYCGGACDTSQLVLRAATGEANRIRVAVEGDGFAFSDAGAPLHAGPGCAKGRPRRPLPVPGARPRAPGRHHSQ